MDTEQTQTELQKREPQEPLTSTKDYLRQIFWSTGIIIRSMLSFVHSPKQFAISLLQGLIGLCGLFLSPLLLGVLYNSPSLKPKELKKLLPNTLLHYLTLILPLVILALITLYFFLNISVGLTPGDKITIYKRLQAILIFLIFAELELTIFCTLCFKLQKALPFKEAVLSSLSILGRNFIQLLVFGFLMIIFGIGFYYVPLVIAKIIINYSCIVLKLPYSLAYFLPFWFYNLIGCLLYLGGLGCAIKELVKRLEPQNEKASS